MNAVGIDVSKGKSMAAIGQPYVLAELRPFIKGVIRDLKCVLFIGLDFSHTVCIVVIYKQRVDYANKYTCVAVFPNANTLFSSPRRETDGHEKWVDFVLQFPHRPSFRRAIASLALRARSAIAHHAKPQMG